MDPSQSLQSILNPSPSRLPGPCLLHRLVTAPCESEALNHLDNGSRTSYSYHDLHRASDAIANRLASVSRDPETQFVVPVLIHQSPTLYITLLGILKAGGAFCPLNTDAPPERLKFIFQDVSAKAVLVSKDLASKIPPDYAVEVIVADSVEIFPPEHVKPEAAVNVNADDLAYVMYTSGSTGTPKGVGISHDAVTQSLLAHDLHVPSFSRFLQFAAPTFDVSVFEIFFPLFRGQTLISVRRSDLLSNLPAAIRDMNVDACELTPTVAGSLLRSRDKAPSLKLLLTIGEMLTEPVIREFGGSPDRAGILWGMYGPTEATIHCTLQTSMSASSSVRNIGFPLDTVSCFVARPADSTAGDNSFEVLPQGEVGELVVGGHQLAAGYLNRPEQTVATFISTPYGRLYRTGDKARLLTDGTLECLGRLSDGQVKLRGQRLELGEVQQAILRTPGCHGAVVVVQDSILVAFCSVDSDVSEESIYRECGKWLPQYMMPGEVVLMDTFPSLPSGKVDKRKLIAGFLQQKEEDRAHIGADEPADIPTELKSIVSSILDMPVDARTSLSASSLDSLSAIRIASSLRAAGFEASIGILMEAKSVSDLWTLLQNSRNTYPGQGPVPDISLMKDWQEIVSELPSLESFSDTLQDVIPCTPLQTTMLFETLQNPEVYWNDVELEVAADAQIVVSALRQVVKSNEALRTSFTLWKNGFISLVFKDLIGECLHVVDEFESFSTKKHADGLLQPLKVQIRPPRDNDKITRILVQIHHAVYDGWSMDILRADLATILQGSQPSEKPQFRKVAEFSHALINDDSAVSQGKAFWADHLLGWVKTPFPKFLDGAVEEYDTLVTNAYLPVDLSQVEVISRKLGYSVQSWLQTSLAVVWSGILGTKDVVFGSVTSGRAIPVPGIDQIIGPCIAPLPLRVNLDSMTEVSHILNHIQATNNQILKLPPLPLSEIRKVTNLQPGDAIYDVLFVYQQSPESGAPEGNIVKERHHRDRLETRLLVEIDPQKDGFGIQVTYRSDSMSSAMVQCLIEQFKDIFQKVIDNPRDNLVSLSRSLSVQQSINNQLHTQFKGIPDLASMVETTVSAHPDSPAICFASSAVDGSLKFETTSYQELNRLSNRIARYLQQRGVQPRSVVGIIMEKSVVLYASILAVVKAGCAYLPILPTTPIGRIQSVFDQAEVRYCLTDGSSPVTSSQLHELQLININDVSLSEFQDDNLHTVVDGSRIAYVIYTSGTTGAPKGVAVTQLNIASNISNLAGVYPTGSAPQARLLQLCSQAFDVSVFEIFFAWHTGMCLCSGTNDTLFNDLEHAIRELDITHLSLTPTVASLIDPSTVPSVEFLVTAGEPLTQAVLDKWSDQLWQGYGPSETTNICSVKKMALGMPIENLGRTLSNTSVTVRYPDGSGVVPIGWVGEFWIGGEQVAQGYLNLNTLTASHFVHHPQLGRVYRTGDMGRMLPDGSLVILGRLDDQLKLRGQRINPKEINSVVTSEYTATAAVTMIATRGSNAPDQLVTFYVPAEETCGDGALEPDTASICLLFSVARSNLPPYMVPSYLIPISKIPLTSSGKWNKAALQKLFSDLDTSYLDKVAPPSDDIEDSASEWSVTETLISEAIVESMRFPASEVNRWTPFPNFGIDSLTAIGVVQILGKKIGHQIPVSLVIQNSTIAQLGRSIDERMARTVLPNALEIFPKEFIDTVRSEFYKESKQVESILPCTPLQEAMLAGGQRSYYNKVLLRLKVDDDRMRSYWGEMVRRHGILRTCFVTTTDARYSMAQVVLQDWQLPWESFKVRTPSFDEVVEKHLSLLPPPVDHKSPPISLAVLQYRDSTFLSFICHHALYDGIAMSNLWREVESLANGVPLPRPIPYEPFLKEMVNLPRDTEQFWKSKLHGFNPSRLFSTSPAGKFDQAVHTKTLKIPAGELYARLRTQGVSLLSICQAAWANTISLAYDCPDVCFGNVVSGRSVGVEGIEKLVAPCFNTIPLRADLSNMPHGGSLVKYFYQLNSEVMKYQFTPLRLAQRVSGQQGKGLFESLLLLQNPLEGMDDRVWILESDAGDMDIPLVCEVVPCPSLDSLVISMHYDMHVMDPSTATGIAELFEYVLESILDHPFAALSQRQKLPSSLKKGLSGLRRRERTKSSEIESTASENWSEIEQTIRQIFSDLSGRSKFRIARHTTIYQLGLDSINAVQLASILRGQGMDVSASDVIECPTCARLGEIISNRAPGGKPPMENAYNFQAFAQAVAGDVRAQVPSDLQIETILPSTPMQCAFMTAFTQSGGQHYLNFMTYDFSDSFTIKDATHAWQRLHRHHPMLRTALVPVPHPDSTFAMLTYSPESLSPPITAFSSAGVEQGDVNRWLESARKDIIERQHLPPWHVLIYETDDRLSMRILMHHALYDATSLEALLRCYSQALLNQNMDKIPNIKRGLGAILTKSARDNEASEPFWKGLKDSAVVNKFPVMTPLREENDVLEVQSLRSSVTFQALRTASEDAGYSIQAIIQAAWVRLLSSYLGEASVIFGMTFSGRTDEETAEAPFPCVVTLPVVASDSESNHELLNHMMNLNSQIHKYNHVPLSQVQKWLGHPASPVFDTLVSFRKTAKSPSTTPPFALVDEGVNIDYPVSLEIETTDETDTVTLTLSHKVDILPREQALLMLQQFDITMKHLAFSPHAMGDDVQDQNPTSFSHLPAEIPEMACPVQYLHQFVEQKALSQPNSIALEYTETLDGTYMARKKSWTYKEFDDMGNRLARAISKTAKPGSIVAIHFGKCPEAYFSILGILKAGCSFVALDPTAPGARKNFILRDSNAPCLLTGAEDVIDLEANTPAEIIRISDDYLLQFGPERLDLGYSISPSSTCYCLYTSGTTGTPKGCEITHENAVQAMMAFQHLFSGHWDAESRWLQFAALHFDVSVLEQYWSWSVGITVVAAPKDVILDDLTGAINKLEITHIDLTPSLARLTHPDDVPSLCKGVFITGGESLKQEILDAWGPKAVIYNAYGPTEATIGVTMYQRVPVNGRPSNIGKQFPNVGSYVLRPGTETPVLRGGVGELCVSGKLVGKGYLNRPELTSKCFPHMDSFAERVYRTGDLVRLLHDGCIDFLGRADDQVKLRGQRLEIGEINHAIRRTPGVTDAATIVASHGPGEKSVLVSFLVSQKSPTQSTDLKVLPDDEALGPDAKEACRNSLPGYMVPTYFLQISYIPLSVNNKAEVKKLKRLFSELSHSQLMAMTASTSASLSNVSPGTQSKIIDALSDFCGLGRHEVTGDMNIFDIGVDSLSALRLSSLLKARGVAEATPSKILQNPTINDLVQVLSRGTADTQAQAIKESQQVLRAFGHRHLSFACDELNVTPSDIEYIAPCTPLQEGIISKSFVLEGSGAYFNTFSLQLKLDVDEEKLHNSWAKLFAEEPIFRTVFLITSTGPIQVALKQRTDAWRNVTSGSESRMVSGVDSLHREWLKRNHKHVLDPLQLIFTQNPGSCCLHVNIFHAVYDGVSFDLILSRIAASMTGQSMSRGPSFLDAASLGPLKNFNFCREFWEEHLKDWRLSTTPALFPSRPEGTSFATRELSASSIEKIRESQHASFQSVLLALWISVLQRYHPAGLTLGVIVAGRSLDLAGIEHTIGPLFNTLPFFNRTLSGHTWASLVQKCQSYGTAVLPFQHVPLQKIQKWCSRGQPLFDTLFTLHAGPEAPEMQTGLWEVLDGVTVPDYPLAIEVTLKTDGSIQASLVSQGHIADSQGLGKLLDQLADNLEIMASRIQDRITDAESICESSDEKLESNATVHNESPDPVAWSTTANAIRGAVASIAGVDTHEIESTTSLLELGLDSIDVMKLAAKLRSLKYDIPGSQIMRLQTVPKIAVAAEESMTQQQPKYDGIEATKTQLWGRLSRQGLAMSNFETVLPATPLQESMVAAMVDSGFSLYFNHDVMQIADGVDMERLQSAWNKTVETLPILRTGFVQVEDLGLDATYYQVVYKEGADVWSHVSEASSLDDAEGIIKAATNRAKLSEGRESLFQLSLFSVGTKPYLVLSIAHALYDGWSLGLIFRELKKAYAGKSPSTPPADNLFRHMWDTSKLDHEKFWATYLRDSIPTFIPKLASSDVHEATVHRADKVSSKALSKIQRFCKKSSISLQVLCQASWAMVLARLTGQLDVSFGVVTSGRDFEGAEELVFPTMNTVAVRCILHGSASELLQYLEDTMGHVREHQITPLRKIQTAANATSRGLFNSLFLLQKGSHDEESLPLFKSVRGMSAIDYPVSVEAEAIDDSLMWRVACDSRFLSQSGTSEILRSIDQVIGFYMDSPDADVISLSGSRVSICGLPLVPLSSNANSQEMVALANDYLPRQWTKTSSTIRDVLSKVSGIESSEIRLDNNLYHLGLDSISALKVSSLLRKRAVNISPRALIGAASIANMAELADKEPVYQFSSRETTDWALPASMNLPQLLNGHGLAQGDVDDVIPALPMQVYMLGAWENAHGTVFYPTFTHLLSFPCSDQDIEKAWEATVASTPMLRTSFVYTNNKNIPVLQVVRKSTYSTPQAMANLTALWNEQRNGWVLKLQIHHALYDGFSLPAIMQKLARNVVAGHEGSTKAISVLPQWSALCTYPTTEQARASRKQFWTQYLSSCSPKSTTAVPISYSIERVSYIQRSAIQDASDLRQDAARLGLGIQTIFLAAYAKILAARTTIHGTTSPHTVVFGIYLANRGVSDINDRQIPDTYPRLNLVPLKVYIKDDLRDMAAHIQKDIGEISIDGRADVGLWEIDEWTGIQITSFVNFLSGPSSDEDDTKRLITEIQELDAPSSDESSQPRGVLQKGSMSVRDSFPPAIDIEASLHESGLDIGVFGPVNAIGNKAEAAMLVQELCRLLQSTR